MAILTGFSRFVAHQAQSSLGVTGHAPGSAPTHVAPGIKRSPGPFSARPKTCLGQRWITRFTVLLR